MFDTQGRRLRNKMPRSRVEFASIEQRLKGALVQGHMHNFPKWSRRELKHMRRVSESVFNAAQLAARDHLDPFKPKSR